MGLIMENLNDEKIRYDLAVKRLKKIKSFYVHLLVFIIINSFVIYMNIRSLPPTETVFQFKVFSTAFFWGIGLLAHAVSVFGFDFIFGNNWEAKKIKQFMEEDRRSKWE
jgi:hypothetical protein